MGGGGGKHTIQTDDLTHVGEAADLIVMCMFFLDYSRVVCCGRRGGGTAASVVFGFEVVGEGVLLCGNFGDALAPAILAKLLAKWLLARRGFDESQHVIDCCLDE